MTTAMANTKLASVSGDSASRKASSAERGDGDCGTPGRGMWGKNPSSGRLFSGSRFGGNWEIVGIFGGLV